MIDQDIDYCNQQIEAQAEKINAITAAINHTDKDIKEIESQIEGLKTERGRLYHMNSELAHKRKVEIAKQREMIEHRDNLKDLKKMMKIQNKMMDKKDDK